MNRLFIFKVHVLLAIAQALMFTANRSGIETLKAENRETARLKALYQSYPSQPCSPYNMNYTEHYGEPTLYIIDGWRREPR